MEHEFTEEERALLGEVMEDTWSLNDHGFPCDRHVVFRYGRLRFRKLVTERKRGKTVTEVVRAQCPLCNRKIDPKAIPQHLYKHDQRLAASRSKAVLGRPVKPLPGQLGLLGIAADVPTKEAS